LNTAGVVEVYLHMRLITPANLRTLQQYGVQTHRVNQRFRTIYAAMPINALETVAALPFVRWIGPPSYSVRRTGSVTSEGDIAMRTAELRDNLGIDGSSVRIGIISDSLLDLQASVNSGDLPPEVRILDAGSDVVEATDEGRAMAEIIHDLAPGATLLFHSGFPTSLDTIAAIQALTDANVNILVDDIGFLDEPVFEDGPVAQTVQEAIDKGIVYVTAAGNDAERHYRGTYKEFDPNDGDPEMNLHDFGGGDTTMAVRIDRKGSLTVILQWPNPFDGSANTADYDLFLFDARGKVEACNIQGLTGACASTDTQLSGNAPPLEMVTVTNNTNFPVTVTVAINRFAGEALPLVLNFTGNFEILEHNVAQGSIFGHPCVRDALAVAAIDANDPNFNNLERFSSRGPCEIFFPVPETRTKPDLAGADGVTTSLASFSPFFGTSAAAPHVAAVAALLIEAAGGPGVLEQAQIGNTLRLATVDLDAPGNDNASGHGAVDAMLAAQILQAEDNLPPESTIDAPADDVVVVPGAAVTFQGACVDAEGNGPFTFAWDFGDVAAPSNLQNPGTITFPTAGTFPISFTCTDADGAADLTPATRTITVNQPPESHIDSPPAKVTVDVGSSIAFTGSCSDAENHVPFSFLWFFGGGADIASSTLQKPGAVRFSTAGTFTVSFTCTDALGTSDASPATVQVVVRSTTDGGGCSILPPPHLAPSQPLAAMGNIFLPLIVIAVVWAWRRIRTRRS
jgi:subtilisin family serine protease